MSSMSGGKRLQLITTMSSKAAGKRVRTGSEDLEDLEDNEESEDREDREDREDLEDTHDSEDSENEDNENDEDGEDEDREDAPPPRVQQPTPSETDAPDVEVKATTRTTKLKCAFYEEGCTYHSPSLDDCLNHLYAAHAQREPGGKLCPWWTIGMRKAILQDKQFQETNKSIGEAWRVACAWCHPKGHLIPPPYHVEAAGYRAVTLHPRPRHLKRLRKLVSTGKLPWLSRFNGWETWSVRQKDGKIRDVLRCVGQVIDAVKEENPELQATLTPVRSILESKGKDAVFKPYRNYSYFEHFTEVMEKKGKDPRTIPRCTEDILDTAQRFGLDPLAAVCYTEAFLDAVDQEGIYPEEEVEAIADEVEAEIEAQRRSSRARKRAKTSAAQTSVRQLLSPD